MNLIERKITYIINRLIINYNKYIKNIKNINDLNILKSKFIGKNSIFKILLKKINNFNILNKKNIGCILNNFKQHIIFNYTKTKEKILLKNNQNILNNIDITISVNNKIGNLHPISIIIKDLLNILISKFDFELLDNKEIDNTYNNFDLLNIPINHPSRNKTDTFWIDDIHLLRTQTSNIQSRLINNINNFPIKIISYGKVYRKDKDKNHSPMFNQMDIVYIDKNINFSNLKFMLIYTINNIFNDKNIKIKFRPSYFPFTEPSIEIDILKNKKYIEILGAGMISKKVLHNLNINYNLYTGFAFGIGIERIAMIKYNIDDISLFFKNDLKFLNQFKYI